MVLDADAPRFEVCCSGDCFDAAGWDGVRDEDVRWFAIFNLFALTITR